jgi:[ribosomal protein S18]-alanine N-acetyltransferase
LLTIKEFDHLNLPKEEEKSQIIQFLFEHLDQYGDPIEDIEKCLNYALKISQSFGGFALLALDSNKPVGAVIVNKTGMDGYIPGNILVYIAIHIDYRGKGLGKNLMKKALTKADGPVKLHVEPDNPARFLYEKLGFESKYLEMRCPNTADYSK